MIKGKILCPRACGVILLQRQPLHPNSNRHEKEVWHEYSRRRNFAMTDSFVDHGLPPLQPHKGQPSACSWTYAFHPCSITEIALWKKGVRGKQHVKHPAQYTLRRMEGIVVVHKGDRVSPYTLKNNIHKVQQEEASEGTGKGKTKEFNIQQLVALKKWNK